MRDTPPRHPPADPRPAAPAAAGADGDLFALDDAGLPLHDGEITAPPPGMALVAMKRGLSRRCPCCGIGHLFIGYTRVAPTCPHCGLETGRFRADDAPPYLTILVVGHVVVTAALLLEQTTHPPMWLHIALWCPLTVALSLILLPMFKGMVIGIQWSVGIRG